MDNAPNGDAPDGDAPDGDAPDGDAPEGDAPEGDPPGADTAGGGVAIGNARPEALASGTCWGRTCGFPGLASVETGCSTLDTGVVAGAREAGGRGDVSSSTSITTLLPIRSDMHRGTARHSQFQPAGNLPRRQDVARQRGQRADRRIVGKMYGEHRIIAVDRVGQTGCVQHEAAERRDDRPKSPG